MKLNLLLIAAISCLGSPLTSIAQSSVLRAAFANPAPAASVTVAARTNARIPWNQIGAKAGADYQGDGLAVSPTGSGARLHCVFQQLGGEATADENAYLTTALLDYAKRGHADGHALINQTKPL
jgi:hypothetical protein